MGAVRRSSGQLAAPRAAYSPYLEAFGVAFRRRGRPPARGTLVLGLGPDLAAMAKKRALQVVKARHEAEYELAALQEYRYLEKLGWDKIEEMTSS